MVDKEPCNFKKGGLINELGPPVEDESKVVLWLCLVMVELKLQIQSVWIQLISGPRWKRMLFLALLLSHSRVCFPFALEAGSA